jgi:hypothetical protein
MEYNMDIPLVHLVYMGFTVYWSGVKFVTDSQSASSSWCQAVLWGS